jgi:hypothetical protein
MVDRRGSENMFGRTEAFTKACLKMDSGMVRAFGNEMLMEIQTDMKENTKMINNAESELLHGLQEMNIKEIILMI